MKMLFIFLTLVQFSCVFAAKGIQQPSELELVKYDLWNKHEVSQQRKTQLQKVLDDRWSEELEVAINLNQ